MEALQNFFESFRFASPLLALGGAAVFLAFIFFFLRRRRVEKHSHLDFLGEERLLYGVLQKLFLVSPFLIAVFLLLALAQPQVVKEVKKTLEAKDIVIVLDTSGSMMIGFSQSDTLPNFEQTRLGVAWQFLREFVKARGDDRMAVIPYDDPRGYIARGFTDDQEQLLSVFNKEEIEGIYDYSGDDSLERYAIHRGTNTPNGLKAAQDYFEKESKAKTKLIILVTDLDDDPYEVPGALARTREKGIMIYTIGIVKDKSQVRLERLRNLFKDEGLRFFVVQNREDFVSAMKSIDQMEKSQVEMKQVISLYSISWVLIVLALFFAAVFMTLCEKFKKIP